MEKLLNLNELGERLKTVDSMMLLLSLRRFELAAQVGKFKQVQDEPDDQKIFRSTIEDGRIEYIRKLAELHSVNPHFAESLVYLLINESCKLQMIQLQNDEALRKKGIVPSEVKTEDEWYNKLKHNLLELTERWCAIYDTDYETTHFATAEYSRYEQELIGLEVAKLSDHALMLDLGCATGRTSFLMHKHFDRIIGYDISQHMQARASELAETRGLQEKLNFEHVDLEDGIPLIDESVSFVVMNLGTASDVRNIKEIINETLRVLKPGGRFFFSFYNRDALMYRWEFLPWQSSLAAVVNIHRDSLDVHSSYVSEKDGKSVVKEEIMSVFARAYTTAEVAALLDNSSVEELDFSTYPTVSSILPNELFTHQPEVRDAVTAIDIALTTKSTGAYIIATGQKV